MRARVTTLLLLLGCGDGGGAGPADAAVDAVGGVRIPDELADADALGRWADWSALPVLNDRIPRLASSRDRGTATDTPPFLILQNGNRDMNHFVCAQDEIPTSGLVPFVYDGAECPSGAKGYVIADVEGSGFLTRLWMTDLAWRDAGPRQEVLRIWVGETLAVEVPIADILEGRAGEMFDPPFRREARGHLAWRYPVVFSRRLVVAVDQLPELALFYHQTSVSLDPSPRERRASGMRLAEREDARQALDSGPGFAAMDFTHPITLEPGESETVPLSGEGTIRGARLRFAAAEAQHLRGVDLTISWDGGPPAVQMPLADFFAATLDLPGPGGVVFGGAVGDEAAVINALPMPFLNSAAWTFTSRLAEPFSFSIQLNHDTGPAPGGAGRLHAIRSETLGPTSLPTHPMADVTGRGRLAGACLFLEGHELDGAGFSLSPFNFLEGDETITVDGVALLGTGTEDYLDSAFYFAEGPFADVFAQVWGAATVPDSAPAAARVSGCRWHVLGVAIDFATSLAMELEIGPGQPSLLDRYRTVVFLYR